MNMSNQESNVAAVKLDARAYPIKEPKGSTMAYASITINDVFAVQGIRVVNGEKGLFAAMPSAKDSKGEYRDVCFPVTRELRSQIQDAVLSAYTAAIQKTSVIDQIKEGAKASKDPAAPAKEKNEKNKSGPEL